LNQIGIQQVERLRALKAKLMKNTLHLPSLRFRSPSHLAVELDCFGGFQTQ